MRRVSRILGIFLGIVLAAVRKATVRAAPYLVAVLGLFASYATDIAFWASLGSISIGLWWERPSLALIVPGVVVLVLAVFGRLQAIRGT